MRNFDFFLNNFFQSFYQSLLSDVTFSQMLTCPVQVTDWNKLKNVPISLTQKVMQNHFFMSGSEEELQSLSWVISQWLTCGVKPGGHSMVKKKLKWIYTTHLASRHGVNVEWVSVKIIKSLQSLPQKLQMLAAGALCLDAVCIPSPRGIIALLRQNHAFAHITHTMAHLTMLFIRRFGAWSVCPALSVQSGILALEWVVFE